MKLMELFSGPASSEIKDKRLDPEINYLEDLKFFIDNEDPLLSKFFFPAISKHKDSGDDENSYKLYIAPIRKSIDVYCDKFKLNDIRDDLFSKDSVIKIAKRFAEEQKKHIGHKDYD
jgi:hypothetical protein